MKTNVFLYFCFCHSCSCSQQLKIFESRNQLQEKKWTHDILTRKNFGHTKYPFGPRKYPLSHDGTKPTRPTIARDPRNLAHTFKLISVIFREF